MKPIIYADTLFLFNFFMNTVILLISGKLLRVKTAIFRLALSSAMGAVYAVLMFFPEYGILYSLVLKIIILFGIEYIAFGGKSVREAMKNFGVFVLVNVCVGGLFLALIFLTDFGTAIGSVVSGGGIYINLSPVILLIGIGGTYTLLGIYGKMCRRRLYEKSLIKRIEITYKGKTAEIDLFLDTGCRVLDPINDKGVIIAEYNAVKLILSENERAVIENSQGAMRAYENGMRMLPFSTINGDNMIYAITADKVKSENFSGERITVGLVTHKKFGKEYKGLINPVLLLENNKILKENAL